MGKRAVFCRFWCRNRSRGTLSHGHRAGDPGEHCHRAGDPGRRTSHPGRRTSGRRSGRTSHPGRRTSGRRTSGRRSGRTSHPGTDHGPRTTDHGPRTTPRSFMRQHPEAPAHDSLLTTERLARANCDPGKESAWTNSDPVKDSAWTNEHKKTPPDINRTRSICYWFFIKRLTNADHLTAIYYKRL